jgi:hypothetical protein
MLIRKRRRNTGEGKHDGSWAMIRKNKVRQDELGGVRRRWRWGMG